MKTENMTTSEFIQALDSLFAQAQYDKVEPFLLAALEEAKERADYGLYLSAGNEMIGYYRSLSQFQKAYQVSEDMLLLMEELQMDQSAEFATVLLNTATAYSFDENFEMALQFYRRAEQTYQLLLREDDYLFAGLYNNMSSLMEKMGRNEEAVAWYGRTLSEIEKHYGFNLAYAVLCENLAHVYRELRIEDSVLRTARLV